MWKIFMFCYCCQYWQRKSWIAICWPVPVSPVHSALWSLGFLSSVSFFYFGTISWFGVRSDIKCEPFLFAADGSGSGLCGTPFPILMFGIAYMFVALFDVDHCDRPALQWFGKQPKLGKNFKKSDITLKLYNISSELNKMPDIWLKVL